MKKYEDLLQPHDPQDPDPWFATLVDTSIPINPEVKRAWLVDTATSSRQYLLPIIRPFCRLSMALIQVFKIITPKHWRAVIPLHKLIAWGMKKFVSYEANWLIMRHFHLGAEIQQFVLKNLPGVEIPDLFHMRFECIDELSEDAFLKHDLNLYNFIIWINQELRRQNRQIAPPKLLDFSMITDGQFPIKNIPQGRLNKIDLLTAIEIYTPVFQFFLTDNDFWRASNSLQLDETLAIYASRLLNDPLPLLLVNNKHPMIAKNIIGAGYRLVLHGLATEMLHAYLVEKKREQKVDGKPDSHL